MEHPQTFTRAEIQMMLSDLSLDDALKAKLQALLDAITEQERQDRSQAV